MENIARYLRLYACFVRFSVSRAMEFRFDFFFRVVMDGMFYVVSILFFEILFLHSPQIGGWSRDQVILFVSGCLVVDALNMTVFSNNLWALTTLVNRGDLDYYLVRPVSTLFFVSLRDFATNSFINLWMALGILVWAIARFPEPLGIWKIALFTVMIVAGTILHFLLHLCFLLTTFWTLSGQGAHSVFWSLNKMYERPDRIYTGWFRKLVVTALPFGLVVSFPTRVLVDPFDGGVLAHFVLVLVGFAFLVNWIWGRALRVYSSASS